MLPKWAFSLVFRLFLHWQEVSSAKARKTTLAKFYNFVVFVQELSFLIIGVAMSLINSKLCKLEINEAIFFSIIFGNTIHVVIRNTFCWIQLNLLYNVKSTCTSLKEKDSFTISYTLRLKTYLSNFLYVQWVFRYWSKLSERRPTTTINSGGSRGTFCTRLSSRPHSYSSQLPVANLPQHGCIFSSNVLLDKGCMAENLFKKGSLCYFILHSTSLWGKYLDHISMYRL